MLVLQANQVGLVACNIHCFKVQLRKCQATRFQPVFGGDGPNLDCACSFGDHVRRHSGLEMLLKLLEL